MKKAYEFYYEEYLDKSRNDVNEELDAMLKKLLSDDDFDAIQSILADVEAKIEESAFKAGFQYATSAING